MSALLLRRLEALESRTGPAAPRLILLGRVGRADGEVTGIRAAGARLPQDVHRLPGETLDGLEERALALVQGPGPLVAGLCYGEG